jgi:hypothetical protein
LRNNNRKTIMPCNSPPPEIPYIETIRLAMGIPNVFLLQFEEDFSGNPFESTEYISTVVYRDGTSSKVTLRDNSTSFDDDSNENQLFHIMWKEKLNAEKKLIVPDTTERFSFETIQSITALDVFMSIFEFLELDQVYQLQFVNKYWWNVVRGTKIFEVKTNSILRRLRLEHDPQVKQLLAEGHEGLMFRSPLMDFGNKKLYFKLKGTNIVFLKSANDPVPKPYLFGESSLEIITANPEPIAIGNLKQLITDKKNWRNVNPPHNLKKMAGLYFNYLQSVRGLLERFVTEYSDTSKLSHLLKRTLNFVTLYKTDSNIVAIDDILLGLHMFLLDHDWFKETTGILDINFTELLLSRRNRKKLEHTTTLWKRRYNEKYIISEDELFKECSMDASYFSKLAVTKFPDCFFDQILHNLELASVTEIENCKFVSRSEDYQDSPNINIVWNYLLLHPLAHRSYCYTSFREIPRYSLRLNSMKYGYLSPENETHVLTVEQGVLTLQRIDKKESNLSQFWRFNHRSRSLENMAGQCITTGDVVAINEDVPKTRFDKTPRRMAVTFISNAPNGQVWQVEHTSPQLLSINYRESYGTLNLLNESGQIIVKQYGQFLWKFEPVSVTTDQQKQVQESKTAQKKHSAESTFKFVSAIHPTLVLSASKHGPVLSKKRDTDDEFQKWVLKDGFIQLSSNSNYVLDIDRADKNPMAQLIFYKKIGKANQLWTIDNDGCIVSQMNGMVLDVDTSDKTLTTIVMYPKHGRANQKWYLENC